jgi:predicted small lipoprotein YifL
MLISKQILVSAFVLGASVTGLTGCGQTGALYLPTPKSAANTEPGAASTTLVQEVEQQPIDAIKFIAVYAYLTGASG